MSNRIFDIRASVPYPDWLYVDANVIIKIADGKGHEYEKFLIEAVRNGSIPVYSQTVLAEVKRWLHRDTLRIYAAELGIKGTKKKTAAKVLEDEQNSMVGQAFVEAWDVVRGIIVNQNSVEAYMPSPVDLDRHSNTLIARYGLGVGDAEHIAIMNHNQTNSILTDDGGFAGVPALNVYSKSWSALRNGTSSSNTILPFTPLI